MSAAEIHAVVLANHLHQLDSTEALRGRIEFMCCLHSSFAGALLVAAGMALDPASTLAQANLPVASTGDQVVIKREACHIVEPNRYRVPLSVEAINTVTLVAPFDGMVKQLSAKANAKVLSQGEVLRLDSTMQKLALSRAQLVAKAANAELKLAETDESKKELAQLKVDIAKIDVEIAQATLDQATIRMPFAGEVQRLLVTEGEYVRAGDPVAIVSDNRVMKVEIPVERSVAEGGKTYGIKVEQDEVEGKFDSVLPLSHKFETLRELFDSVVSAVVTMDNASGKYKVGQTVYVPLIPRQPVAEVPNAAVGNVADGQRKVQVVRKSIVRDIPVKLMGQVGSTRVFVSGPFADGDEVIYETSHQLGDGFQLKSAAASAGTTSGQPGSTTAPAPATTAPKPTGF